MIKLARGYYLSALTKNFPTGYFQKFPANLLFLK
jgi:hypothetical protein